MTQNIQRFGLSSDRITKRKSGGFSLVEVVMAIGVVAFAMMGLIGVIPVGLAAAQESIRQTAQTHILNQISSDLQQLPADSLTDYVEQVQYYDYDGRKLNDSTGSIFKASLEIGAPEYPGSDQLENLSNRIERIVVSVYRVMGPEKDAKRVALTFFNTRL